MLLFTMNAKKENRLETYGGVMAIHRAENVHGPMATVKQLKLVCRVGDFDPPETRNYYTSGR